jgi:CO/xanthine dehydrogenase Mo-binding subunit
MSVVGQSVIRVDSQGKVTGATAYPGDLNFPNQVYMKVLFARRPHAIVKRLDTHKAEQMDGVVAVLTAKDVPVNEYGLGTFDQPVLCGPGSNKPYADHVRFVGDQIALVVADSEEIAARALELIEVDFEDLPVITDPLAAMAKDAVLLHPDRGNNIISHYRIRKGDVNAAFAQADVVIEGEYHTPSQEHAYLQPEAGVGTIDEQGRVTVYVAGQWAHEDQEQIAHALNLPLEQVRVIYPAIGGAFGGREDMSVQIILALAAWRLRQRGIDRPVKIIWSREESMIGHHKRHPYIIRTRWAANRDGKVLAAEVQLYSDGGAYTYTSPKVLGNATLMCTGPYEIPNVSVDSYAIYTNNIPNGAFRGFGGPQGAFAAELQMAKLAEALGMDAVELRMRNVLREGSLLSVGTPLPPGVSIAQVLEKCALQAGWTKTGAGWQKPALQTEDLSRPYLKRGLGIAAAFKNVGFSFGAPEQSWATVKLEGDETIEYAVVYHAGADCGQGAHTVFAQVAAETLGIPFERVQLVVSDTAVTQTSGSASASRMTFMAGNSVKGAALAALEKWKAEERPAVATYQYRPPRTTPMDPETGKSEPNFAYGYVAEAVEVEVDVETGQLRLKKVICADDVGKAVNPLQVQGQIEGAVVQAAGYAVMENFVQQDAIPRTFTLSTYLIPTNLDVPDEVDSMILEYPDPIGPYGARGMGEMPYLPLAGAVGDALHEALGSWVDAFPYTPEHLFQHLHPEGDGRQ